MPRRESARSPPDQFCPPPSESHAVRLLRSVPSGQVSPGRFYLPDGIAGCEAYPPHSPYDRLIMVREGEKHEPMSLDETLKMVILRPGDACLIRRYVWEYVPFSHPRRFLCIIPRGGYLRLADYRIKEGQTRNPWPEARAGGMSRIS